MSASIPYRPLSRPTTGRHVWLVWAVAAWCTALFFARFALGPDLLHNFEGERRWVVSDWLINYQGGFVRRGLIGELIFQLSMVLGVKPHVIALAVMGLASFGVVGLIVFSLARLSARLTARELGVAAFSPLLLSFYLLSAPAFGRKELLFLLLGFVHLQIVVAATRRLRAGVPAESVARAYLWKAGPLFLLLGVPAVLSHETFLFLALPVNAILTFAMLRRVRPRRAWVLSALVYVPVILATGVTVLEHGSQATIDRMCAAFAQVGEGTDYACGVGGAADSITYLASSMKEGLAFSIHELTHFGFIWPVLVAITALPLLWVLRVARSSASTRLRFDRFELRYLALPLLCSVPAYVLGSDWGRWFTTVLTMFLFCSVYASPLSELGTRPTPREGQARASRRRLLLLATVLPLLCLVLRVPPVMFGYKSLFNSAPVQTIYMVLHKPFI
jgi:hypothetical protein